MSEKHILVIEDEEDIVHLLEYNLQQNGFRVSIATDGVSGLLKANDLLPDLIVLDLMLPGLDGLELCRQMKSREKTQHIPIVMLTARSEDTDMVAGLEMGADDYIPKPFSPKVLIARIRAVMRRIDKLEPEEEVLSAGELQIHPGRHEAKIGNKQLSLTHMEFRLLQTLAARPGWVFSRTQIVNAVQREHYAVTDRAVDVLVAGLRKKLGEHNYLIETVRGVGYRFKG